MFYLLIPLFFYGIFVDKESVIPQYIWSSTCSFARESWQFFLNGLERVTKVDVNWQDRSVVVDSSASGRIINYRPSRRAVALARYKASLEISASVSGPVAIFARSQGDPVIIRHNDTAS